MNITILTPHPPTMADLVPALRTITPEDMAQRVAKQKATAYREQEMIRLARLRGLSPVVVTPRPAVFHAKGTEIDFERRWEEDAEMEWRAANARASGDIFIGGGAAAGAWTFTNGGRTKLMDGTFDIDSDSWKMAIDLSTSNIGAATTTHAGVTNESGTTNTGYTTGGIAQTLTLAGTTTVTVAASASPTWTAGSATLIARFLEIYEVSGNVLVYALADSAPADVTTQNTNTFTVTTTSSIFTLA